MTANGLTTGAGSSSVSDRVVVVTGANAGLGLELSRRLARTGAHVVMACRSLDRAERARERLLDEVPEGKATILPLDVAELESIREFRALLGRHVGYLDVLINNAGIFGSPLSRNRAGHEMHLATNYLGPFALTGALLPLFRDRPDARIVNVGSLAHLVGALLPDALNPRDDEYHPWKSYARSKVALLAYTMELDRRLRASGSNIMALCAHPGVAPTEIAKGGPIANPKSAIGRALRSAMERLIPSVTQAAEPILHAACNDTVLGGDYYGPGGWLEVAGAPANARVNGCALDRALARQLWSTSERLAGVSYLSGEPNRAASGRHVEMGRAS
jgi:NAD(P)-dependent dehydrogenase (short-subunit alcohol dehydrogenase family)